jgi:hypothetical protein
MALLITRTQLPRTRYCFGILAGLLLLSPLAAQSPEYRPPPPPVNNTTVEVRLRYLVAPDVNFTGLGTVPFSEDYRTENNPFLGTTREINYDDGFLSQDFIESSLVEGGVESGLERVPSSNNQATAFFGYNNPEQVDPAAPDTLIFHRYASGAVPDEEYSADAEGSLGWEINYTKYLALNRKLGFTVGFSFNGFDSRFREEIDAGLYVQEFRHRMADGADVPDLPEPVTDDEGNVTQAPFVGDLVREEGEIVDLLEWAATAESEELIEGGAVVDSRMDMRSSFYNFKAGPTYNLSVGNRFGMQLGAGVSAIYFSGTFSAYEILNNPAGGENPSRSLTTTDSTEWQVGGYVDASAYYQLTQRVSVFSGMQMHSGSSYKQANEDRFAEVDISSQIYVHAGFGIRF